MTLLTEQRGYYLALLSVAAFLLAPIVSTTYLPLVDFPNHLSRAYILYKYASVSSFATNFVVAFEPIPNLATDLLLLCLLPFMSPLVAAKLFVIVAVVAFICGCHFVGRAIHGSNSWLAIFASSLVYCSMLLMGWMSYLFGVAIYLLALAFWLSARKGWNVKNRIIMALLVMCCYLCHLTSVGFLGISVTFLTLWDCATRRGNWLGLLAELLPFVPTGICFVWFMQGSGAVGRIEWNTLLGKLVAALSTVLSYDYVLDAVLLASMLLCLVALLLTKQLAFDAPVFSLALLFGVLYLLCPKVLLTSFGADARFVLPFVTLIVLSGRLCQGRRAGSWLLVALIVLALCRVGAIWRVWTDLDRRAATAVAQLRSVPYEARLYPLFRLPSDVVRGKRERSFEHLIHYATIERNAFVPTLFALPGQQPLRYREPRAYASLAHPDVSKWTEYVNTYDYVWGYNLPDATVTALKECCRLIGTAEGFQLWRLEHAQKGS